MVDISKHSLLKDTYDLMRMIEEFPASDQQTATITKAGEILEGVDKLRVETARLQGIVNHVIHCEKCGGSWYDDGFNSGCPCQYHSHASELAKVVECAKKRPNKFGPHYMIWMDAMDAALRALEEKTK